MRKIIFIMTLFSLNYTAFAEYVLHENFDNFEESSFANDNEDWTANYCSDQWTTKNTSGIMAMLDSGCDTVCTTYYEGCHYGFGYYANCAYSDPFDNHIVTGNSDWKDYFFDFNFKTYDNDTMGAVFRYENSAQFYLLIFTQELAPNPQLGCDATFSGSRLYRIYKNNNNGILFKLLAQSDTTYETGKIHKVRIIVFGNTIKVLFDKNSDNKFDNSEILFDVTDDSPNAIPKGKIGFYTYQTGKNEPPCDEKDCRFDDASVFLLSANMDTDGDGVKDYFDNCINSVNPDQSDIDSDDIGDICDDDKDGDKVENNNDNCPALFNPDQKDIDSDEIGDLCDNCYKIPNPNQQDSDSDKVGDVCDNCPDIPNPEQTDSNGNGIGDACDIIIVDSETNDTIEDVVEEVLPNDTTDIDIFDSNDIKQDIKDVYEKNDLPDTTDIYEDTYDIKDTQDKTEKIEIIDDENIFSDFADTTETQPNFDFINTDQSTDNKPNVDTSENNTKNNDIIFQAPDYDMQAIGNSSSSCSVNNNIDNTNVYTILLLLILFLMMQLYLKRKNI